MSHTDEVSLTSHHSLEIFDIGGSRPRQAIYSQSQLLSADSAVSDVLRHPYPVD